MNNMIYLSLKLNNNDNNIKLVDGEFETVRLGLNKLVASQWAKDCASLIDNIEIGAVQAEKMPSAKARIDNAIDGYMSAESKTLFYALSQLQAEHTDKEFYQIVVNSELDRMTEELEEALKFSE